MATKPTVVAPKPTAKPVAAPGKSAIVKQETQLATAAPDYISGGREGFETVDSNDLLERLSLMQDGNPEVKDGVYSSGDIVLKKTQEVIYTRGGEPVRFIVAGYFKEFVEFGDRTNPQDQFIIGRSTDRTSKLAEEARQWLKKKQSDGKLVRKVQDVHNFAILLDGRPMEPFIMGCHASSWKSGAALLSLANARGDYPIYAGLYTLVSEEETNKRNQTYNVLRFKAEGWATEDMFKAAQSINKMMASALASGKLTGTYDKADAEAASEGVESAEAGVAAAKKERDF